ncbi:MAG: PDZ domain-containing protein [Chloroflexi bacterium]|nr:PDZ domain-containing protein [Chloroflexota bacterium]
MVRAAVEILYKEFYEPLSVADLLLAAWEGAVAALSRAGVSPPPSRPTYSADPRAAYATHAATFPALEERAHDRLAIEELAAAALKELLARRRDGHTFLNTPRMAEQGRAVPRPPTATLGLALTDTPPIAVADLYPGGPAQRAGLRRGDTLLTINGRPATDLRRFEALAEFKRQLGSLSVLAVQTAGGGTHDVQFEPDPLSPPPITRILPGSIGLLRLDGFGANATEQVRNALTSFERSGVRGWIFDMRWNSGGESIGVSRLLVSHGRLFSRLRHNDTTLSDGRHVPMREDIDADGAALPFQRPAVILIGPGSLSGAESFAGPMQTHRRATLVGERTGGLCGRMAWSRFSPGWSIAVAHYETVFDPEERARNRIGVTPDVPMTPSSADETAGRDPQLEAALDLLRCALS